MVFYGFLCRGFFCGSWRVGFERRIEFKGRCVLSSDFWSLILVRRLSF